MSNQEIMMSCRKCGSKHHVGEMNYDSDGSSLICTGCAGKQFNKPSSSTGTRQKLEKPKKIRYICTSCNYKFSRDPGKHRVDVCPYCSKEGNIEEYKEQGAEKLLREATEI